MGEEEVLEIVIDLKTGVVQMIEVDTTTEVDPMTEDALMIEDVLMTEATVDQDMEARAMIVEVMTIEEVMMIVGQMIEAAMMIGDGQMNEVIVVQEDMEAQVVTEGVTTIVDRFKCFR